MNVNGFIDGRDRSDFVKQCERLIRVSDSYRNYVKELKNTYNLDFDAIQTNIDSDKAKIEFHHYPFTLYDITDIIISYLLEKNGTVNSFMVSETVMEEHYENNIGLVSLHTTNHQLYHDGQLSIPSYSVFGDFLNFMDKYKDFILESDIENVIKLIKMSSEKNPDFSMLGGK